MAFMMKNEAPTDSIMAMASTAMSVSAVKNELVRLQRDFAYSVNSVLDIRASILHFRWIVHTMQ